MSHAGIVNSLGIEEIMRRGMCALCKAMQKRRGCCFMAIETSADRSFVSDLYDQHKEKIYKTAYKILQNTHDAEDMISEIFVKIINNIRDYHNKSEDELASIIVAMAKNIAIDKYRRKNKIEFVPIWEDYASGGEPEDEVGDYIITQELYGSLYKAIDTLGEDYSRIVKLKMGNGFNDSEIAEILGISVANVKTRYHRAKKALSEILKGEA